MTTQNQQQTEARQRRIEQTYQEAHSIAKDLVNAQTHAPLLRRSKDV